MGDCDYYNNSGDGHEGCGVNGHYCSNACPKLETYGQQKARERAQVKKSK